ncbi:nucleic acid-binding protein [Fistulina hepatica ATCC 64428]|uniref:Nucleic acid-binding protein n=1 Tax=Fistulina hepatica ATCC 64428 TaxID=1128425 RepID=A0A0D7A525_9AGAR|nr:nucleic acid-binding protein [Fistulina hepatica ATCC 64428]
MLGVLRNAAASRGAYRAFSTSAARHSDLSKLVLIGRLGKDPEIKTTKNDREYITYSVATTNYPPPPPDENGERPPAATTWHHIFSFSPSANRYLQTLQKGQQVYCEANFEVREPEPSADPDTPQGQRQIFLRHETIRVLSSTRRSAEE